MESPGTTILYVQQPTPAPILYVLPRQPDQLALIDQLASVLSNEVFVLSPTPHLL